MIRHHRRQIAYDRWANAEILHALRAIEPVPERPLRLLSHVAAAQRLWLDRIDRAAATVPVWPELAPVETAAWLAGLDERWDGFFDALLPERLEEGVEYVNSKGEPWSSTVGDILAHVALHGSYHRGQIATLLREAGHAPPYTDYIHAARTGMI
jgi:uncharacterized damage-inducible protein DinB